MAILANYTTSASATTRIIVKAYKITTKDGLYGTMTVEYIVVTYAAIIAPPVIRIKRVLRVACLD